MSQFITTEDYDASVHREILESLTRMDDAIVEICEDRAIAEMRGYLATRYDVQAIFSATGTGRHQLVLMFAIDIAIYHLFCVHNPMKLSQVRKDRYNRAIEWLKQVSSLTNPLPVDGLPIREVNGTPVVKSPLLTSSRPKRQNHY